MVTLTILAFSAGCEEDQTIVNTIYDTDSTQVLAIGEVVLRPTVDFRLNFIQRYAQSNIVDSVKFADSLCRVGAGSFHVWGDEYCHGAYFYNPADGQRFQSGDTAVVQMYSDRGVTTANIKLFLNPGDSVIVVESVTDTTADILVDGTAADRLHGRNRFALLSGLYWSVLCADKLLETRTRRQESLSCPTAEIRTA